MRNLAKVHINLNPVKGEQIVNFSELALDIESGNDRKSGARINIAAQAKNNRDFKRMVNNVR